MVLIDTFQYARCLHNQISMFIKNACLLMEVKCLFNTYTITTNNIITKIY